MGLHDCALPCYAGVWLQRCAELWRSAAHIKYRYHVTKTAFQIRLKLDIFRQIVIRPATIPCYTLRLLNQRLFETASTQCVNFDHMEVIVNHSKYSVITDSVLQRAFAATTSNFRSISALKSIYIYDR